MTETNIVYLAKLHWILFFWPAVLAVASIILGIEVDQLKTVAFFLFAFSLVWAGMYWMTYLFSSLTIKKKQLILRTGILVRQTIDIPLTKIESIDIKQSIIGSMLGYGSLVITGTGGTKNMINFLEKPLTCRRYIEQLMHGSEADPLPQL
ncbi:MAG: PH domain-containing protein [Proteobacteria bacterium]|nr:PH domain-containing protein [Pseudomonadota bacterium]